MVFPDFLSVVSCFSTPYFLSVVRCFSTLLVKKQFFGRVSWSRKVTEPLSLTKSHPIDHPQNQIRVFETSSPQLRAALVLFGCSELIGAIPLFETLLSDEFRTLPLDLRTGYTISFFHTLPMALSTCTLSSMELEVGYRTYLLCAYVHSLSACARARPVCSPHMRLH